LLTSSIPYIRPLGDGLVLKSMNGEADAERLIAFNQHIFGIGDMTRLEF
jgi:hypothetical protein